MCVYVGARCATRPSSHCSPGCQRRAGGTTAVCVAASCVRNAPGQVPRHFVFVGKFGNLEMLCDMRVCARVCVCVCVCVCGGGGQRKLHTQHPQPYSNIAARVACPLKQNPLDLNSYEA